MLAFFDEVNLKNGVEIPPQKISIHKVMSMPTIIGAFY